MKLWFHGAARVVTGSCYLLEAAGLRLLIDCGLFQGRVEDLNRKPFPFQPDEIDAVVLTHAHIDHSGRLPLLYKQGYRGPVYTHPATLDLVEVMLLDSARIQEQDAQAYNRRAERAGRPLIDPLYGEDDVEGLLRQLRPVPYEEFLPLSGKVSIRLRDAGHILGSAAVEIMVEGEGKLVFSGDIGQPDRPILEDPALIDEADYVVMESTYGNRLHEAVELKANKLLEIILETIKAGGNLVIPAFSVGRTQELLYELNLLAESGQLPAIPVVVDSPLGARATEITRQHREVYDSRARELLERGDDPFDFPGLRFTASVEESKELNTDRRSKVIIAGSGMCEGGRVVHHLRHNLWRPESTVLFVGYQAEGTLGRRIRDGAKRVKVVGEEVVVRARIAALDGFSAHADQSGLLNWLAGFGPASRRRVFLTHGELEAQEVLAALVQDMGIAVEIPTLGESVNLRAPQARKRAQRSSGAVASAEAARQAGAREFRLLGQEYRRLVQLWRTHRGALAPEGALAFADRAAEVRHELEQLCHLLEADDSAASGS